MANHNNKNTQGKGCTLRCGAGAELFSKSDRTPVSSFSHLPVMLGECIEALAVKPDGVYADCTVGGGGHSFEIARRLGDGGMLFALDRDAEAIEAASERLAPFGGKVKIIHDNFVNIKNAINGAALDGALLDLGVSSRQIDCAARGFSYIKDAPLDMRMDRGEALTAVDVVNGYPKTELERIIYQYGEERRASRIASAITAARERSPIRTTAELASIIKEAVPYSPGEGHPAKRAFQAIRIEVNRELDVITPAITDIVSLLKPGGRIAVITFHSLEDRPVKQTFASLARGCDCPPSFPVCVCGKKPLIKLIGKPVSPSARELGENSRSHSAKLRAAEKL